MEKYSLKTGLREQTILKEAFFTTPFKLVEVRENKKNPLLEVMVMSSSPGMLNNDTYDIAIEVIADTYLNLQTQAYQRIYVSEGGTNQVMNIKVGENAYFSHAPHPVVPHGGAKYYAENIIHLTSSSTLLWGEILTCGRKFMEGSEEFTFKKHHSLTKVYVDNELVFKDNLYVEPQKINIKDFGLYESYTHQGSLFFIASATDITERIEKIYTSLEKAEGLDFGISKIRDNAYLLRILAYGGEKIFKIFTEIRKEEDALINARETELCKQN
jgi:urease accessory protein